jgi:hypothetical protein
VGRFTFEIADFQDAGEQVLLEYLDGAEARKAAGLSE